MAKPSGCSSRRNCCPELNLIEGVSTDITARKNAEDALLQERQMLDNIIELNPYGIAIYDADGHYIRGNPAFVDLFGSEPPPEYNLYEDPILKELGHLPRVQAVLRGSVVMLPEFWYDAHRAAPDKPSREVWIAGLALPGVRHPRGCQEHHSDVRGRQRNGGAPRKPGRCWQRPSSRRQRSSSSPTPKASCSTVIRRLRRSRGTVPTRSSARPRSCSRAVTHEEEFYADLWDTIKSGRVWSKVIVNRRKDGTLYEEEATISPIRGHCRQRRQLRRRQA